MNTKALRQSLARLPRSRKRLYLILLDVAGLLFIVWASFSIRLGEAFEPNAAQAMLMLAAPAIAVPVYLKLGLYRAVIRYLPGRALWTIFRAHTIASLVWVSLAFLTEMTGLEGAPRIIPVLYWLLGAAAVAGSRFSAKWLLWRGSATSARRTLIVGTGEAATQLASAFRSGGDRLVVGFLSDDRAMQGLDVMGLRVHPFSGVAGAVRNFGVQEVILATVWAGGERQRALLAELATLPVKTRVLPPIAELASGRYLLNLVHDIDIDDLLGRSEVPADPALLRNAIEGRAILVTGAAGSIGSALANTVAALNPARLVLYDTSEHGLYQLGRALGDLSAIDVVSVLGSITDERLVRRTLEAHDIETVFHCAAYKHVTLVEENRLEGVRNNVLGTEILARAARAAGVGLFLLISSDKAVRPAGVMGATKRWSELIVSHHGRADGASAPVFAAVRFGNVIGSSGSVVPLFKEQIAAGGPITLTHPEMTRYFMSVREAAELIVQAASLAANGDILLLEMGRPIRIADLARDMVALAGLTVRDAGDPDGDIAIELVGQRAGEKLSEELAHEPVAITATDHPKILRVRQDVDPREEVPLALERLKSAIDSGDEEAMLAILFGFIQS